MTDHDRTGALGSRATIAIVGGGLAGATAAAELRDRGFDGGLVLVADEPETPYERPPLSKGYLRGASPRAGALVHDEAFYDEREIDLRTGAAAAGLDVERAELTLAGGERVAFDRLLIATGATPRRLAVDGAELAGVHHLRTLADCDALRADLAGARRALVVGAGWIGCEVAASLRELGIEVALADVAGQPLEHVLGADVGAGYAELHAAHGVELLLGERLRALAGAGRVERATFAGGRTLDCDLVVAGIGVTPRAELARGTPIAVGDGIAVDARLETAVPGIFAAGDVASVAHPLYRERVRVEHWDAAREQGRAAARNMLGGDEPYERVPYFFSDQYDASMEYWGRSSPHDEVVVRGSVGEGAVTAVWLRGERATAVMAIGRAGIGERAEALLRSLGGVDRDELLRAEDLVPAA